MTQKVEFWKNHKKIRPVRPMRVPRNEGSDLVKAGVGLALGAAALGIGLAAFKSVTK